MKSASAMASLALALLLPGARAAAEAPPAPDLEPRPPAALDFQLLDATPATAAPAALDADVARRRQRLTIHQATGIATSALLAASLVTGELDFADRYGDGEPTLKFRGPHRGLSIAAAATFAFTGTMALSAPEPYAKRKRLDTTTVHRASMATAAVGMVAQLALGILAAGADAADTRRDLDRSRLAVGWGTFAAMAIGSSVHFF